MRDTLQLIRKDDNDAVFRPAAAGAGKVVLSKLAWSVPIVQPNDVRKVNLYKSIASNNVIPVSFRMRQYVLAGSAVSPSTFRSLYPIHVFDESKQSEQLTGIVDLTVRMEFSADIPANTQAYGLVISDRINQIKFKSDGSQMSVLF